MTRKMTNAIMKALVRESGFLQRRRGRNIAKPVTSQLVHPMVKKPKKDYSLWKKPSLQEPLRLSVF
ncbi:Uncharacterised protein [Mycobacterium tuberculosis]|nr:Uncharacterised protein [Mycobacterium tuberculosis]